jgi:Arc/MetJ-type ribon-helix-helix transcriptional regulator
MSMAEVIRKGIRKLRETQKTESYRRLVENTRGIWGKGDGLKYQMDIRSEWNRQ